MTRRRGLVARLVWHDAAPSVEAIADLLAKASEQEVTSETVDASPKPAAKDAPLRLLHRAALVVARQRLRQAHEASDRILAQEVRAVEDLQRSANLLVERLREWYSLHAPEAVRQVDDAERLAVLVDEHGDRAAVLAALGDAESAATSFGTELAQGDLAVVQGFAHALRGIHESWRALEARIEGLMGEVAPNIASVVGPMVGGRLIAQAGGLERLATWPTGTVQLLGAETALFRHIKEGTKPPKHGLLFQHPLVFQAPPWQRGAVARALAGAVSTAARADAFTRNDLVDHLKAQVEKDLQRIRTTRSKPSPRRAGPPRAGGRGPPGARTGPPGRGPPASRTDGRRGPPDSGPRGRQPPGRGPPGRGAPGRGPPDRGPPGRGPPGRGPPDRGPPGRGSPDRGQPDRGPPGQRADGPRTHAPSRDGARAGPPRDAPRWGAPRTGDRRGPDGGSSPPQRGPWSPRSPPPSRKGEGHGDRRDGPPGGRRDSGPRDGARDRRKDGPPKRKRPGAFRDDNKPAKPPGK